MTQPLLPQRVLLACLAVATVASCTTEQGRRAAPPAPPAAPSSADAQGAALSAEALIAQVGVEPGEVAHGEGAHALLAKSDGRVELRRLGSESFAPAQRGAALYAGDQVRVGEGASANVVFADESTAELAELSTLGVGSRVATADPASSAALLSGVARFSVTPRAPGEGSFLVFLPSGVVATKGTVFGVGVAAQGDARVGVESGQVEVAGASAMDAPVDLSASAAVELDLHGKLGAPARWDVDDWGSWRDKAEAELEPAAVAQRHGEAMAALGAELTAGYDALLPLGQQVASFEASAALAASGNDAAAYRAELPRASAAIDASFLAGLHLEWLTHAYLSHAVLASDLYVRHPEVVSWPSLAPRVHAAVLWPKRLDAVALAYFEPLRVQYYLHHPRGREQAPLVGIAVPRFYAAVHPQTLPQAHAQLGFRAFVPPQVVPTPTARAVWVAAPSASWQATAHPAPPATRGKLKFWLRPPKPHAKVLLGAAAKAQIPPLFVGRPKLPRGQLKAAWNVKLGQRIKVSPPDLGSAARARLAFRVEGSAPKLQAHADVSGTRAGLDEKLALPKVHARAKADLRGAAQAKAKVKADLRASASAHAKAAAETRAELSRTVKGAAKVKVALPTVRPPSVQANVKGSARFSVGR